MNRQLQQALQDLQQLYQLQLLPEAIYHQQINQLLAQFLLQPETTTQSVPVVEACVMTVTADPADCRVYDLCVASGDAQLQDTKQVAQLQYRAAQQLNSQPIFFDFLADGTPAPNLAIIPAGEFYMGSEPTEIGHSENEQPCHAVIFHAPFAMATTALTYADYAVFCRHTRYKKLLFPPDQAQRPVVNLRWQDAVAYCAWLSDQCQAHYRLPSEAEWEYAARAGSRSPFHYGETIDVNQANYDASYIYRNEAPGYCRGHSLPVGSFPPNAWGLYDIHGNVWEWLADDWHETYRGAPTDGSVWVGSAQEGKVVRGGSWQHGPSALRCAQRGWNYPDLGYEDVGFRVVRELG